MSLQEDVLRLHYKLGPIKSTKPIKSPPIIPTQNFQIPVGYRLVKIKRRGRKSNDTELLTLNRLVRDYCGQTGIAKKNIINSSSRQMAKERFKIYAMAKQEGVRLSAIAQYFKKQRRVIEYGIQQMGGK